MCENDVEGVESGVCGLCTQYRYIQCYVKRVEKSLNSSNFVTHVTHVERVKSGVFGLCTQYRYIQCYVKRVDPFDIHGIGWYGWKGLSLSFPKLFSD